MKSSILLLVGAIIAIGWALSVKPVSNNNDPPPVVKVDQIVSQLQTVEELASLKVAVSGIVSGTQPGARFWQGESRLVLLVRGTAIYSVDLSRVEVDVVGDSVTITVPDPRISDHWVDVDRTEIWQRHSGRFRRDEGLSLEAACWASAKAMVYEAALAKNHQEIAKIRVERIIAELLRDAAHRISVQVRWA